ncbi:hypothetical protein GCM10020256_02080 [Streptomyces thermocoprophilus]
MTHPVRRNRGGGLSAVMHELDDLRTRMDQLMHSVFPVAGYPEFDNAEPWAPPADVVDADNAYLVELELPGVDKDQITVEVSDGPARRPRRDQGQGTRQGCCAGTPAAWAGSTTARPCRRTPTPSTSARS